MPSSSLFEVVGAPDHHDAVVAFQSVHFVQKEAPSAFGDHTVQVLEDKKARGMVPWSPLAHVTYRVGMDGFGTGTLATLPRPHIKALMDIP